MTGSVHEEEFAVLWPGGPPAVPAIEPAARPQSLDGARIGFLWDHMFRGEEIFPVIEAQIRSRFRDVTFVGYEAFGSTFGGEEHAVLEALPARLQALGVDAVISGNGC